MKNSKQQCLMCRDTGYVVWADENCTTSCYCDCACGDAAYHRDMEAQKDVADKFDFGGEA